MDNKTKIKKSNIILVDTQTDSGTLNNEINKSKKRGRKKKCSDPIILSEQISIFESSNKFKITLDNTNTNNPKINIIDESVNKSANKSADKSAVDNISNNDIKLTNKKTITRKNSKDSMEVQYVAKKEDSSDDNNNILLKELLSKQLKNISGDKKLSYNDIIRINKFINISIFDPERCSLWNGYVTNEKNKTKGTYINFYFNKKKIALHRLLYINYIGEISNEEYIKFSCENKGKCCNINHMKKYLYSKNFNSEECKESEEGKKLKEKTPDPKLHINTDKKKLIIEF